MSAKNYGILNFSSFSKKSWFPGQKQGFSYSRQYPRKRSNQKPYFLKNESKCKNSDFQNLSSFSRKLWFPGQKQVFGYNTKYPRIRTDQKTYILKNGENGKKLGKFEFQLIQ